MPTPIIATFYSFRGGVGRTMAVLNAGWVLARTGSRVLLIDFDLEAPGLTRLIARQDLFAGAAESVPGMADIIVQLLDTPDEWAFHADKPLPIDLSPYLRELKLPDPKFDWLPRGRLALISAGAESGYESRLGRIHSEQFTLLHKGFADRFREALLKAGQFDYILVDARTGFSDEAYIACRYLCDRLVVLKGLNDQNIEGTGRFLSKVAAWSEKEQSPRNIILIASPVPEHEEELKAQRFAQAKVRLAELSGAKPDFALQLPYHPRVSLYEEVIVERFPQSGLGHAYRKLAEMLRGAAQDSYRDWAQRATEAISRDDMDVALAAARRAAATDASQAITLLFQIGTSAERLDRYGKAQLAFEQALAISRETSQREATASALFCMARLDRLRGLYADARRRLDEALHTLRELGDRLKISVALEGIGQLDCLEGRYAEARRNIEESLASFRELGLRREIGVAIHSLAEVERLAGRYVEARNGFGESLAIARELGDRLAVGVSQRSLAELDTLEGRYADAKSALEEALATFRELGQRPWISSTLHSLAKLERHVGRYAVARCGFEEALAIDRELGDRPGISVLLHSLGELERLKGCYAEARRNLEESLATMRELGDRRGISSTLQSLAELDYLEGHYGPARHGFEESLTIDREMNDRRGIVISEFYLHAARAKEDATSSLADLMAAAQAARNCPDPSVAARSFQAFGQVLRQRGELAEARSELSAGIEFAEGRGVLGLAAEMRAERALAAAEAGEPAQAAADARAALAFFDAESVAHPQLARLRELAAAPIAPQE